jgi:hypothetical protein
LPNDSVANVSQIVTLDRSVFSEHVARLPETLMQLVLAGIGVVLGAKHRPSTQRHGRRVVPAHVDYGDSRVEGGDKRRRRCIARSVVTDLDDICVEVVARHEQPRFTRFMGRCDAIVICSADVRLPGIKDHRYRHRSRHFVCRIV